MGDLAVTRNQRAITSSAREENVELVKIGHIISEHPRISSGFPSLLYVFKGDPISITKLHHPTKKHFAGAVDDPQHDQERPYQHLTKVKLRLDHYRELDHTLLQDITFIVNVPILCHTGDPISVQIGSKVISVECPRLARRQNRFILCFVK